MRMPKTLKPLFVGCCWIVLIALLVACQASAPHEQATVPATTTSPENPTTDTLASRIDHYVREHYPQFSGTILVAQKDHGLMSQGYGLANRELDVPNTPQTKFAIGSITKSFTAMAIMILQDRGKLTIQDSICQYLSECPRPGSR